jgi:hypothetical protein
MMQYFEERANTPPMAISRTTTIVLALSAAVLLAGCGKANSASGSGSAGPTSTPDSTVAWANSVCTASVELRTSVHDAGAALNSDLSAPVTSVEQAKAEVRGHADAVQQSAANLARTLSGAPVGAVEQSAVLNELETASRGAQAAVDQVRAAAGQVADAETAAEVSAGLAALKSTVAATAAGVRTYLESLSGTVGSGEQAVRDSFGAAPVCQELTASAKASP